MSAAGMDIEAEIDRLYQLPLAEFTAARNALASRVKGAGDKDGAARVKALARATVTAWAANQVHWGARREFEAFLASVERLRSVQAEAAGGEALRDAMRARREALAAVMRRAESLLVDAGHAATPEALRRVSDTLQALAAAGAWPAEARPGRLVHDLEPPGFEAFAALAGVVSTSPATKVEAPGTATDTPAAGDDVGRGEARVRARDALEEAERRLERARREAREAAGARAAAEKRASAARVELEQAARRYEQTKERAAGLAADEDAARRRAEQAADALAEAEAAREDAVRALRALN